MNSYTIENSVVILDLSRSTRRTDFSPNRHQILIRTVIEFYKEKNMIDPNDRLSLIIASNNVNVVKKLTSENSELLFLLSSKEFSKKFPPQGDFNTIPLALKQAFSILGDQIRAIGGEIYRILIITDHWSFKLSEEIVTAVKIAEGLNIHIDICLLQTEDKHTNREDLLFITKKTRGELGIFYSGKAINRGIKGFASKLILDEMPIRLISPREKDDAKYLVEYAMDLRSPNDAETEQMKLNPKKMKCQICFSNKSPINGMDFAKTGRYCSFCSTPMHLHCAAKWAQKSEVAPGVFRCPYCYTLLKISLTFFKGLEIRAKIELMVKKGGDPAFNVKMVRSIDVKGTHNNPQEECHFCFQLIIINSDEKDENPEEKIFQCSNCGAKYHVKCLEQMYKSSKSCQNCGGKIS